MKIIVAGMPKTGTKSMKAALTLLGYTVYDAEENFDFLCEDWTKIMTVGGSPDDFRRMYADVDATCDVPACYYWEEMHKAFPDAKILLMTRETEDEWWQSMKMQLEMLAGCDLYSRMSTFSPHCTKLQRFLNTSIRIAFGVAPISPWQTYTPNEQSMRIAYRNHNARVLQVAPSDKLLVYKCAEGWEPLCRFLGCQTPDEPFPHKNRRGSVVKEGTSGEKPGYKKIQREITMSLCAVMCGVGYLAYRIAQSSFLAL